MSAQRVERLNAAGVPAGPVLRIDETFADPQVRHLQMTGAVEHETEGRQDLIRHPVNFSDTPAALHSAAPRSGAHTRDVLGELGYSAAEIDELIESGAAAERSQARGWTG